MNSNPPDTLPITVKLLKGTGKTAKFGILHMT